MQSEEGAEGIHHTALKLLDLPTGAQKHLALVFEWAIEGIRNQIVLNRTPELEALLEAYAESRDILVSKRLSPDVPQSARVTFGA